LADGTPLGSAQLPRRRVVQRVESEVLPLRMWNIIENMLDVRAAAASGVLIGLTLALLLCMERITNLSRYVR
jgi:ABC-type spermidine/putrescine transport system permease subunit II